MGVLVSDALVKASTRIKDLTNLTAALVVRSVEAAVQRECGRTFIETTYTDESVDIDPGEIKRYDMPVNYRLKFRVKQYPISTWTSLKQVTSRSPSTGQVLTSSVITRDAYYVDLRTGIVTLLETISAYSLDTTLNSGLLTSWPSGVNVLLASYVAGYKAADIPADLQEIILRVIARIWHQFDTQGFNTSSSSGEMGTTSYINVHFTEDDLKRLRPFKRWVLGGF